MVSFFVSFALLLSVVEIHGFNPKQNPANTWVYFGRGLNQREIIDLARPKEEEIMSSSKPSTTTTTTTQKLLETTIESIITTDGPTKTSSPIPTTAAPIPTKDSPPVRNLPETIVNETTLEPLEEVATDLPEKEIKEVEEKEIKEIAATSESPIRAKIVVIPKEILVTTDAPIEIEAQTTTTMAIPIIDGIANTDTPIEKSKESSDSSEEAAAPAPSLRTMLRRIFSGDDVLRHHK